MALEGKKQLQQDMQTKEQRWQNGQISLHAVMLAQANLKWGMQVAEMADRSLTAAEEALTAAINE